MNIAEMAKEAGLELDPKLQIFAGLLVTKCARVALANDDLFTMRDILEWYETNDQEIHPKQTRCYPH